MSVFCKILFYYDENCLQVVLQFSRVGSEGNTFKVLET